MGTVAKHTVLQSLAHNATVILEEGTFDDRDSVIVLGLGQISNLSSLPVYIDLKLK